MKALIRLTGILLLVLTLSGCIITIGNDAFDGDQDWHDRQERNNRYIRHLDLGQRMGSVESELGDPDFNESFTRDGNNFQVLYYRTQRLHNDGQTTIDETTPLVFIERELVGWGQNAIDKATR